MRRIYSGTILAQRTRAGTDETFVRSFCLLSETEQAALGEAILTLQKSHPSGEGWHIGYFNAAPISDDLVRTAAAELVASKT